MWKLASGYWETQTMDKYMRQSSKVLEFKGRAIELCDFVVIDAENAYILRL
jgi:hypothetical protein